ncbi:MAG: phage holin family protein [Akkermansiaceae bacterium]
MNPSSDADQASSGNSPGETINHAPSAPSNWREALMGLLASRVALIQLESKDAARGAARAAVFFVAALCCVIFAWALLISGGVAILADAMHWPWYWVALGASALHLLVGIGFALLGKPAVNPAFPITRAEFQKDREWIEKFHINKKPNG